MTRMAGQDPWTVSVAVYPGDEPCPELERLDRALDKGHEFRDEQWALDLWRSQIVWVKPPLVSTWQTEVRLVDVASAEYGHALGWLQRRYHEIMFPRALFPRAEDIKARLAPESESVVRAMGLAAAHNHEPGELCWSDCPGYAGPWKADEDGDGKE